MCALHSELMQADPCVQGALGRIVMSLFMKGTGQHACTNRSLYSNADRLTCGFCTRGQDLLSVPPVWARANLTPASFAPADLP
jgi:hypothetical protein